MTVEERACPECNTLLPVDKGFVTWCHVCEWNLNPLQPEKPKNLFESVYEKAGRRQSDNLFTRLEGAKSLKPGMTLSTLLAILFALVVHLFTIALPFIGLLLLSNEFRNFCTFIPAITCFILAWELRPRFARMPDVLSRVEHPHLYQFVDDIADGLGAKRMEGITISAEYGGSMWAATWRQKKILTLGLPLWSVLNPEERAALVAHELAAYGKW